MIFNEEITIHLNEQHYGNSKEDQWEKHERRGLINRHCSYCGSLHPEDMYDLLDQCTSAEFADRKYGYPHKIYITMPEHRMLKFYTRHLIDITDKQTLDLIIDKIKEKTGVWLKSHLDD